MTSWKKKLLRVFGWTLIALATLTMLWNAYNMFVGGINTIRPALVCILTVCVPLTLGTASFALSSSDVAYRKKTVRTALTTLFVFYIVAMAAVLFFARIGLDDYPAQRAFYRANYELMTNFVPLSTIRLYVRCLRYDFIGTTIPLSNLMGNVLLFMPMAFFLPCLFPTMRTAWKFILLMTLLLAAVEAMQLILCCGSCDIDDVLLNLLGTLLLYGVMRLPPVRRLLTRWYLLPAEDKPEPAATDEPAETAAEPAQSAAETPENG